MTRRRFTGTIFDIEHDPARNAPIALVKLDDGSKVYMLVTEGLGIGEAISLGFQYRSKERQHSHRSRTSRRVPISAISKPRPNDGGKFVRAIGVQAVVVDKIEDRVGIRMPSGKTKWFNHRCRATVGIVAGGGRVEKPFVKAGNKYHKMANTASNWPRVSGVAMNVIDHPFGGGGHQHPGRPKTIARGTSPGRTVGHVAARRTGSAGSEGMAHLKRHRRECQDGVRSSPIVAST